MIEIPREKAGTVFKLLLGLIAAVSGLALLLVHFETMAIEGLIATIVLTTLGVLATAINLRNLLTARPRLRASSEGVWFGGGGRIPWAAIDLMFVANLDVRGGFFLFQKHKTIAFTFRRTRTRLRLPPTLWFAAFSVGDVDVSTLGASDRAEVLVTKLEAMRVRAVNPDSRARAAR